MKINEGTKSLPSLFPPLLLHHHQLLLLLISRLGMSLAVSSAAFDRRVGGETRYLFPGSLNGSNAGKIRGRTYRETMPAVCV